ncbi:MAG: hypothetical protein QOD65_140 [Gaiellales bacterium]|jgi:hypothetical protein|nr:hypothetical protein [Gaiellales bacterium]MDX6600787.1 hypothetical protein [Gaiellales bacterium]
MRRLAILSVCLLALVPAFDAASAAGGNNGSVSRSWISTTSGGASAKQFSVTKIKRLYANFTWRTPASPGLVLTIEWHDPAGALRARWRDKTIKADKKGTRLFAWIGSGVVKGKAGSWKAVLTVGGKPISTSKFRVVA